MEIPRVAYGTYLLGNDDSIIEPIRIAIEDVGYRHVDCAEFYENEAQVGKALHAIFENGKVKREDLWITSKIWSDNHQPELAEENCRKTLADLQIDYLDLLLVHWPCAFPKVEGERIPMKNGKVRIDRNSSVIEFWKALEKLVEKKLVRHIGVSNFTIEMLERMRFDPEIKIQPFCNQVEYHLYMQQEAMRMYCEFRGIWVEGYCPLGSAKSGKNDEVPNLLADPVLNAVAKEVGKEPAQVELKFLLSVSPKTVVLPKAKTESHIKANYDLDFELNDDQIQRLKGCERCFRYVNQMKQWGRNIYGDAW